MQRTLAQRCVLCATVLLMLQGAAAQQVTQPYVTRHWSGQGLAPVYEGFDINADGTYNLWFGYMNRNYEEELEIPIGPGNTFEPGGDRGQPTHFAPRRHKDVFRVIVPMDFGTQKLVWKLTVRDKMESIVGTLNPVWQIDRRRATRGGNDEQVNSNTPPVVTVEPATQTIALDGRATFTLTAKDDGLPKRRSMIGEASEGGGRRSQMGPGLSFEWLKYRGPGTVTFTPREEMLAGGKATAAASFSAPGEYIIQAVVDDGSGESAGNFGYHCCWTNTEVKVIVQGAARAGKQ